MSRSKARLAADWFAKLRINAQNEVEHADVATVEAEVVAVSDSVSTTVSSQLTSVASDVTAVADDVTSLSNTVASKLNASAYTAADVMAKVKTVDGAGSGLDADTVDGLQASQLGVPSGVILLWSGATTNIPSGWYLCNGANGTPNLQDRFVVGAGSGYAVGNTGGASSVTLTTAQMPAHTHTGPSHTHTFSGTTSSSGNHYHLDGEVMDVVAEATYSYTASTSATRVDQSSSETKNQHARTNTTGAHTHTYSGTTAADGTGDTGSAGSGSAHENRPPYYALCYIMKA